MGCKIVELLDADKIKIEDLSGKVLLVDAHNILYQFLTTIRGPDGMPFTGRNGTITSHLIGLFNRTTAFMEQGLKLVFVFDGETPELKRQEDQRRMKIKQEARVAYEKAVANEDSEGMRKFGVRTSLLTQDMIDDSKELLMALGIPVVQAPSEGEGQAAYMCAKGDGYAVVSQDADCLLFGATRVIKNLSVAGKKKRVNKLAFETVLPELIDLKSSLKRLEIDQEQLIVLGILVGTDFDPGGIIGIGPKKGLKLIKEYDHDFDALFKNVKWEFDYSWKDVYKIFAELPVEKKYTLKWAGVDEKKVLQLLCEKHGFNQERVVAKLKNRAKAASQRQQKSLGDFA